jgi:hypothetical protein
MGKPPPTSSSEWIISSGGGADKVVVSPEIEGDLDLNSWDRRLTRFLIYRDGKVPAFFIRIGPAGSPVSVKFAFVGPDLPRCFERLRISLARPLRFQTVFTLTVGQFEGIGPETGIVSQGDPAYQVDLLSFVLAQTPSVDSGDDQVGPWRLTQAVPTTREEQPERKKTLAGFETVPTTATFATNSESPSMRAAKDGMARNEAAASRLGAISREARKVRSEHDAKGAQVAKPEAHDPLADRRHDEVSQAVLPKQATRPDIPVNIHEADTKPWWKPEERSVGSQTGQPNAAEKAIHDADVYDEQGALIAREIAEAKPRVRPVATPGSPMPALPLDGREPEIQSVAAAPGPRRTATRPSFDQLESRYPYREREGKLSTYAYECAIRLGTAFKRAGVDLSDYRDPVFLGSVPRGAHSFGDYLGDK